MGSKPVEIADIFSCGLDVIWRRSPLVAAFRIRLAQMKMNIVVERIAANGKSDGRDVETGCAIGVGMPERNTYELFPFQFENTVLEFVGNQERRIDLSGKAWFPI